MSSRTEEPPWIPWVMLPVAMVAMRPAEYLGDMAYICFNYGPQSYFDQGLRFIKHKPYTLSTGVVLSQDAGSVAWFVSSVIWIALTMLAMLAIIGALKLVGRLRKSARAS